MNELCKAKSIAKNVRQNETTNKKDKDVLVGSCKFILTYYFKIVKIKQITGGLLYFFMNIQNISVKSIKPYPNNAKKHPKTQIDNVAQSIDKFGFVQPIVLSKDNVVVIGHCRLLAAKQLKMAEVPCLYVDDLTDEQIQMLRNLDNKLNESEWDFDLLKDDIDSLDFSDFDIDWGVIKDDDYGTDFDLPSGGKGNIQQITFTLSNMQVELVNDLIDKIKKTCEFKEYNESESDNSNKNGNALYLLLSKIHWEE